MGVHVFASAGSIVAETDQAQGGQGGFGMLPLLVIGALFIGFMMWSNRRRQKQAREFRSNLRPGQRVQLYAGLLGNIVTIGEREVFIELAPGVVVSALPQAVQGVVPDPDADADDDDSHEPASIDTSDLESDEDDPSDSDETDR